MVVRRGVATAIAVTVLALLVGACASRPVNPPIEKFDRRAGYRLENRPERPGNDPSTVVVLAFSGGGMRAAAFSYGVLEELRRTEVTIDGKPMRLLDQVDLITGVSGGSFTALAYGLHGEKLFDTYVTRFLERDVQADLVARLFNPATWPALTSSGWGRSEMAAELYDELLFERKTYADLAAIPGPMILASATDISTGSRLAFSQSEFDLICSDLMVMPVSRAAAASSAVPLVMSPVTINNYGGTCAFTPPYWLRQFLDPDRRLRPAGRALQRIQEMEAFQDGKNRPFLHLVDGGLSDNLGVRAIIESLEEIEASSVLRQSTRINRIRRVVVLVVNSLSVPATDWDRSERPPNDLQILLKATGVPIDRYSYEAVEILKDIVARWDTIRELRESGALRAGRDAKGQQIDVPDIDLYAIDVSFDAHPDPKERAFLNETPTSWVLSREQVERLRAAPAAILRSSSEFAHLLEDLRAAGGRPEGSTK
ncbi:MAG TPA: patatin-like phospholipase family protein [Casimicrobiaceae bacterium]|nr:patatin-like phospholipase family protein [Casimicrobiaceae bacterium]